MSQRPPNGESKIGPFPLEVPPPSPNGSRVERSSPLDPLRWAIPGFVVALVIALSGVPRVAFLHTESLEQWPRLLVAVLAGGATVGAFQRRSFWLSALLGATADGLALFITYGLVQDQAGPADASTIAADLARLLAWAIAGGGAALAAFAVRFWIVRRRETETAKPTFPRPN